MRPSSRTQILQAAVRVTEQHGITALTLEAAAQEAGLTKPGLMYHFRTRDDLLIAIQRYLTETWEELLLAVLGKPLEQSTAQERAAAYVGVNAHGPASKEGVERLDAAVGPQADGAQAGGAGPVPRAFGRRWPVAVRGDQAGPARPRGQ